MGLHLTGSSVTGLSNAFARPAIIAPDPSGSDDTTALNALASSSTRGQIRLKAGATYLLTGSTGLTFDPSKHTFVGEGTKIDASGMTSGVALTLAGTDSGFKNAARGGMVGVELFGSGKSSIVRGLRVAGAGSSSQNSAQLNFYNTVIHDFGTGVVEGDHAWSYNFFGLSVYNCGKALDNSEISVDGGERLTYFGCSFFNNDLAVNGTATNGEHVFSGCSFDFNTQLVQITGPHKVFLDGCHVEYYGSATVPVQLTGSNPLFDMEGGSWTQHTPAGLTTALTSGVAVTTLAVDSVASAIASGDTIIVVTSSGVTDTFTASANVAVGATAIPVISHAPTNSPSVGAKVFDSTTLPANLVSSSAAAGNNRGAYFRSVPMTGVITSSGGIASGGSQATQCWAHPNLTDGTCMKSSGATLDMPASFPGRSSTQGPMYQQTSNPTVSAGGQTNLDLSTTALIEMTVTTTSAFSLSLNNGPPLARTMDLTIVVFNNSGSTLGTITWPASFVFQGLTWTNPASTKRRHLVARFAPTVGKWLVTSVASADY